VAKAPTYHRELLAACTQAQRPADTDRIVREEESSVMTEPDPEEWYHVAALMAYCGQTDAALRLVRSAIENNYCSYSALQHDPLLLKLRGTPEFSELLSAAKECQNGFLAHRDQSPQ
jgi:hypothetical protein